MDYAMPRSDDFPPLEIDHLETPSPLNPLGVKGVGESGTLPVPAVVASAVEEALGARGVRVEEMPLTPALLQRLVRPDLEETFRGALRSQKVEPTRRRLMK